MTTDEIIAALEADGSPSRDLDAHIDATLRIGSDNLPVWAWKNFATWRAKHRGTCEVLHDNGQGGLWWDSQPFTSSVDAAIALAERVIPGCWYLLGKGKTRSDEPLYGAQIMFGSNEVMGAGETDVSPAVALIIAILKASKSQGGAR